MAETTSGRKRRRNDWKGAETGGNSVQSAQPIDERENHDVSEKGKKPRGRTCLQVMATGEKEKKLVEWNARGQPVGDASVKFSSTMGVIVREQVPIVIDTWHGVDDKARESLWKLLMQKYLVDVCFKPFILQQMGKLWRSWKSDLSTEIRKILESRSTNTERTNLIAKLRPHDVSLAEWDQFVQERMSDKWQAKSLKMREIRAKQTLTHTLSRKGYARKEDEHNKKHPDKPLTKPQLWIEAHVSKKKTSEANAAKIVEVQKKIDEAPPTDAGENILTQVLGKERPGRIRGLGAGVTKTKLYAQSQRDTKYANMEARLNKVTAKYKKIAAALSSKLGINLDDDDDDDDDDESGEDAPVISKTKVQCDASGSASPEATATPKSGQGSTHQPSIHDKCKLLNWNGDREVVAQGSLSAVDPKANVHGYTLGPDCYRVAIEEVLVERAEFFRFEPEFANLGDALGSTIAWPIKYLVFDD